VLTRTRLTRIPISIWVELCKLLYLTDLDLNLLPSPRLLNFLPPLPVLASRNDNDNRHSLWVCAPSPVSSGGRLVRDSGNRNPLKLDTQRGTETETETEMEMDTDGYGDAGGTMHHPEHGDGVGKYPQTASMSPGDSTQDAQRTRLGIRGWT
jgi:hypothetical protein